ncbi:MAG: polymer-forming cytoskeletal protein [Spirochaetaceae bacterium]|jgi:cytoskeletal protein CcmA (bactofilin family)|nr:polymer-forming cytoskeletal protein [Spirochaetaceae bacterium]
MPFLPTGDVSINTLIGSGAKFVGDLNLEGFARVDGDVDGSLQTSGRVFIGKNARVRGDVAAKSAVVGGIVEGNITAPDFVRLFSTAAVLGDITTHSLEVAPDVILQGHCIALKDQAEYASAVDNWQDIRTIRSRVGGTRSKIAKKNG